MEVEKNKRSLYETERRRVPNPNIFHSNSDENVEINTDRANLIHLPQNLIRFIQLTIYTQITRSLSVTLNQFHTFSLVLEGQRRKCLHLK